jgi:hypothetical protein
MIRDRFLDKKEYETRKKKDEQNEIFVEKRKSIASYLNNDNQL